MASVPILILGMQELGHSELGKSTDVGVKRGHRLLRYLLPLQGGSCAVLVYYLLYIYTYIYDYYYEYTPQLRHRAPL